MRDEPHALFLAGVFVLGLIAGGVAIGFGWSQAAARETAPPQVSFVAGEDAASAAVGYLRVAANGTSLVAKVPVLAGARVDVTDLFRVLNADPRPHRVAIVADRSSAAFAECLVAVGGEKIDLVGADPGAVVDVPAHSEMHGALTVAARPGGAAQAAGDAIVLRLWVLE